MNFNEMNFDVPLSREHFRDFIKFSKTKNALKDKELGIVFAHNINGEIKKRSRTVVNKFKHGGTKKQPYKEKLSYIHIINYIEALKDDGRNKPLRKILAEYIIEGICADFPKNKKFYSLPFNYKINLLDEYNISLLKRFIAKSYLEDFEDIGLAENTIAPPDIDYQSLDFLEGYISALLYLLHIIQEVPYLDKHYEIENPRFFWFINLMGSFNKMQWETAYDKDNPTDYDTMMYSGDEWIIDSNILQSSKSIQNILVHFCPSRQRKIFYVGWLSFLRYFSKNHFNEKDADLLLSFSKNKYLLIDWLDYCLDKLFEKYHSNNFKRTYDICISYIKNDGYEKCKEEIVRCIEESHNTKQIEYILFEYILLCFSNKVKGIKVVIDLLCSDKFLRKTYASEIDAHLVFVRLMDNLKKYFGTEEIAIRQIKSFNIDITNEHEVDYFINNLILAKEILDEYRKDNPDIPLIKRKSTKKKPPKSFAAINEFRNREEFRHFLQSSNEIIYYFSDSCEETDAEFLKLVFKIKDH